ncbi:MAG: family 43 glycosylhydrolase [Clostridia bacterium]|nr:family 43 glycosylhydrolase [Clostridia bacterium]
MEKYPSNPLLENDVYVPDVEARVWADGRIYLYGTFECTPRTKEQTSVFHVYSSNDMLSWTDHGVAFSATDVSWAKVEKIWAPDCMYRDGVYYLYYCVPPACLGGVGERGCCGVAKSTSPYGPFCDVGYIDGTDGIDPAVLIDDDGQAYLYWGQTDFVRVAKLKPNMVEIEKDSIVQPLSEKEHGFHEGVSARKINGKYYLTYTDTSRHYRRATAQGYAVSDNPMTGFVYKNIIVDNFGCDPKTWNNHGSLQDFKGQWYIFYHRSTHATDHFRQVCVEPITIDSQGDIAEVPMTSSGHGKTILAKYEIPAAYACLLHGNARLAYDERSLHQLSLREIRPNDRATFAHLAFDGETSCRIRAYAQGDCRVELYLDGKYLTALKLPKDETYQTAEKTFSPVSGIHALELRFYGEFDRAEVDGVQFIK